MEQYQIMQRFFSIMFIMMMNAFYDFIMENNMPEMKGMELRNRKITMLFQTMFLRMRPKRSG